MTHTITHYAKGAQVWTYQIKVDNGLIIDTSNGQQHWIVGKSLYYAKQYYSTNTEINEIH